MWATFKRNFTNQVFDNLEQVSEYIANSIKNANPETVINICNYEYAFVANIWTT